MLYEILSDKEFRKMMQKHAAEIMSFLFDKNCHFSVFANIEKISFNPPLPSHITEQFQQGILFVLAGYTYESARVDDKNLYFEAGFGSENIGSFVTVPISSIIQILVEENPIFVNLAYINDEEDEEEEKISKNEEGIKKSMEIFASNPENEKLLKKKRKPR